MYICISNYTLYQYNNIVELKHYVEIKHFKKDINYEWKNLDKKTGICKECSKYSDNLTEKKELCYRCFENWFYENK